MSQCIDDSNGFLSRLFKKSSIPSLTKIKKNKTKNKTNIKRKQNQLDWLKNYVSEKSKDIINKNFDKFLQLFNIYQESNLKYQLNPTITKSLKDLNNEISSYPDKFIWIENKLMISESLKSEKSTNDKYCKYLYGKYFYKNLTGTIEIYFNISENENNLKKNINVILKIINFYITYTINNNVFNNKIPNLKFYYTNNNKCISIENNTINRVYTNSAFTLADEIIIYRNQELLKIMIHELQHFYRIDFGGIAMNERLDSLSFLLKEKYDLFEDKKILLTESFAEANATILNTIFATVPFTKEKLSINLFTEMMFSLYQTAKILDILNGKQKKYLLNQKLKQNKICLEYYYLKSRLLFNYNKLLDFVNKSEFNNDSNDNNNKILKINFPRHFYKFDQFMLFGTKMLIANNIDFTKAINIIMNIHPKDLNLRMTMLEI